jgi:hypothetical protein
MASRSPALPAAAHACPFERAIDVMPGATLDVSTIRGKIAVRAHDGRQIASTAPSRSASA